jgi:hypothetical protein
MLRCCGLDRPLELQLGSRSASGRRRKKGLIDFCSSAARTKTEGRKNALTDSGWHAVVVGAELEIHQSRRHHMPCPSNLLSFSLSPFRSKAKPWPLFSGRTLAKTPPPGSTRGFQWHALFKRDICSGRGAGSFPATVFFVDEGNTKTKAFPGQMARPHRPTKPHRSGMGFSATVP